MSALIFAFACADPRSKPREILTFVRDASSCAAADYIIYRPEPTAGHSDVEHALLSALDVNRRWREARRLLELRGLLGWDLMVAAVKRE